MKASKGKIDLLEIEYASTSVKAVPRKAPESIEIQAATFTVIPGGLISFVPYGSGIREFIPTERIERLRFVAKSGITSSDYRPPGSVSLG